ncbi:malonate--CoA ligase [Roseateles depolymerans]|uniref:Malonyl-CoA synthase n=1 Tax=Roseateles depolymerans TaxID=76731 RepID=A0A0U3CJD9_9BURK|nr:malonyl-CoA synthase [Roseateles depolymerans]ALV08728.1 malonyl-CoA synthase [Roseateles depolymerans]REG21043.1 malonyl-CoA/methylmalonyl-CoA synthetase [Roseateles depolymerans]
MSTSSASRRSANLFEALRASFPQDLDRWAIECADGPDIGQRYTWRDLDRATAMMANLLASLDLPPASRIAVQVDKSVEALMLYLAVLRAGHVYLPLNNAYQAAELEYFIGNAEPAVVVCAGKNFGWVSKLAFQSGVPWVFSLNDDRTGTLLDRALQMSDVFETVPRQADDLAAILYTSGTTGRSKGAMLSHGNLLSNAQVLDRYWGWSTEDVLIHALPIFHVHGLFVASHGALLAGARMLWFNRFDPAAVVGRLAEATIFMGVPTLYVRLLEQSGLTRQACAGMRLFISGSAPLLIDTFQAWQQRTGHTILERYGMSETVMLTSNPYRPDDGDRVGGTVGRPLPGVGLRILDDAGQPCGPGDIGHIQVQGPNVFGGYWRMPEKTREEFTADGWFKTGDVGRADARGYVTIVGRSKDLIISGGYNVYPAEVEGWLNELPGVAESAVIGVPHPDFGEGVIAVVVPRAGASLQGEVLIAALKDRIANFKVPKHIFIQTELPRNAMGKVQKNVLREQLGKTFA